MKPETSDVVLEVAGQLLERHGFRRDRDITSGYFDDRYVEFARGGVRARLIRARGPMVLAIWDGFDWIDVGLWGAAIGGVSAPLDLPPLVEQVEFLVQNLQGISTIVERPSRDFHARVKHAGRARLEELRRLRPNPPVNPAVTEAALARVRELATSEIARLREGGVDVSSLDAETDILRILAKLADLEREDRNPSGDAPA